MLGTENLIGFIFAAILLNLTPGPDSLFIIGRSISQGKKAGVLSALGITTGGIVHVLAAALGLSSILQTSALLFTLVKYAGAAYLIYLGTKVLWQQFKLRDGVQSEQPSSQELPTQSDLLKSKNTSKSKGFNYGRIYQQAIITSILNPKVALFFIAFLPQFINPTQNLGAFSFLFLGGIFLVTGTIWCVLLALFAAKGSGDLRKNPKFNAWLDRVMGVLFIGLGVNLIRNEV